MKRIVTLAFTLALLLSITSTVFAETGEFNAVYLKQVQFDKWNKDDETRAMYTARFFLDAELYAIEQGEETAIQYLDIIISAVEINHIEILTDKRKVGFSGPDGDSLLLMYIMNPTLIVGHTKGESEMECYIESVRVKPDLFINEVAKLYSTITEEKLKKKVQTFLKHFSAEPVAKEEENKIASTVETTAKKSNGFKKNELSSNNDHIDIKSIIDVMGEAEHESRPLDIEKRFGSDYKLGRIHFKTSSTKDKNGKSRVRTVHFHDMIYENYNGLPGKFDFHFESLNRSDLQDAPILRVEYKFADPISKDLYDEVLESVTDILGAYTDISTISAVKTYRWGEYELSTNIRTYEWMHFYRWFDGDERKETLPSPEPIVESTIPPETDTFTFKSFHWGDSETRVRAIEGIPAGTGKVNNVDANYIYYKTRAVNMDMMLGYFFCKDGLYAIRYSSLETHTSDSKYIDDYNTLVTAYTKKYGDPFLTNEEWDTEAHKEYYQDKKETALKYGYLSYHAYWIENDTVISINMEAENYNISVLVLYSSSSISPGEIDYSDEI